LRKTYGTIPPGIDLDNLEGRLIVIEGQDCSGRSTQVGLLTEYFEHRGYPCVQTGLKRSNLVAEELGKAKQGTVLSPRTLSLFYATDFTDQMENVVIPALRAGFIVIADRYIYTPMVRDIVRGADSTWLRSIYSVALMPDAVYYLDVSSSRLIERAFQNDKMLNYWESGMDMGLSRDWHESFILYQRRMRREFLAISKEYGFQIINANRSVRTVAADLQMRVAGLFKS
jgi:dTMP kinase